MNNGLSLTQEELRALLNYDPGSGMFTWRSTGAGRKLSRVAGTEQSGYIRIKVNYVTYLAHRLAWYYIHGNWPTQFIDHINGIGTDNRIINLREATETQNKYNTRLARKNKCGYRGVSFCPHHKKYKASIRSNTKRVTIGYFNTAEEAGAAYTSYAVNLHGKFFCHRL